MDIINWINEKFYSPDTALNTKLLDPNYSFPPIINFFKGVWSFIPTVFNIINIIFFLAAVFFIYIICYSFIRLLEVREKEHAYHHHELMEYAHHQTEREKREMEKGANATGRRWDAILQHLFSKNPGDWKIAIMDADEMLENLLDELGFQGISLGEKLKSVDMEKYSSLRDAWDAHLVRNKIAHGGIDFIISQEEAKKVIGIYEQIFRDFKYI